MSARQTFLKRLLPRGVSALAGASLASQLCTFAVIPLLTRWCSLSDFGLFQIYTSLITISSLIACLRYDYALLIPDDHIIAARIGGLALLAAITFGFAALIFVPLACSSLATEGWLHLRELTPLVAVSVTVTGLSSTATQWQVRTGRFDIVARARLVQSIGVASLQLAGALAGAGGVALIVGDAIGRSAALLLLLRGTDLLKHLPRNRADLVNMRRLAREYSRFPSIATPSAIINAAGFTVPTIFIERYYGTAGLGIYSLLERVMGIPTLFAGQPLSQTFIHRFRTALGQSTTAARMEIDATTRLTALLGVLPFGALAIAGTWLFALVFGQHWANAGTLAQWLALPYFIAYTCWPVMPTLIVLNRLRTQFVWDGTRAIALLGLACIAGVIHPSVNTMIAVVSITMAAFGLIHFLLCRQATKHPYSSFASEQRSPALF